MIDRRPFFAFDRGEDNPPVVGYKTSIECGCCVIVGLRTDNHEVATAACPCSPAHTPVMAEFNRRMRASLDHPLDLELIEVCDTILEQIDVATVAASADKPGPDGQLPRPPRREADEPSGGGRIP